MNYFVEGTVQRQKDKIRIRVQVIRAKNEDHVWAHLYDTDWDDIFDIQSDVAKQVAHELKAILSPEEIKQIDKRPTANLEAYNLYLKGRWFWNKWTDADIEKGMEYFEKAIELDPEFALAYAGLAQSYNIISFYSHLNPGEAFPVAKELVQKALEKDNSIAEAHVASAFIKVYYDWDWEGGEREFKKAIEMDSTFTFTHAYLGLVYTQKSFCQKALDEMQKEIDLALGNDIMISAWKGYVCGVCGYNDEANSILNSLLERSENEYIPPSAIAWTYFALGEEPRYIELLKKMNLD